MTRLLLCLLLTSCTGLIPPGYPARDECREYDTAYLATRSVGIALGAVAGTTGTSGALTASFADEPSADLVLAIISGVTGIGAAIMTFLSGEYAERVTNCGGSE